MIQEKLICGEKCLLQNLLGSLNLHKQGALLSLGEDIITYYTVIFHSIFGGMSVTKMVGNVVRAESCTQFWFLI